MLARQKHRRAWTPSEDRMLEAAIRKIGKFVVSNHKNSCSQVELLQPRIHMKHPIMNLLCDASGPSQWAAVAEHVPNRDHVQCMQRWRHSLDPELAKGPWTKEQDAVLLRLKRQHAGYTWAQLAALVPERSAKQCRERWNTVLDGQLKRKI